MDDDEFYAEEDHELEEIKLLIKGHKTSIRFYLIYGLVVFSVGIIIMCFGDFVIGDSNVNLSKIGGGFVSTLSVFPIKEIIKRKDKKNILRAIQAQLKKGINRREIKELLLKHFSDTLSN